MKHLCTLSDSKYILQGLALINSLKKHENEDFTLYYLCMDNHIYDTLNRFNIKNVVVITESDLFQENPELKTTKHRIMQQSSSMYFWGMAAYFIGYLLRKYPIENVLYIDSDIYFYSDLSTIYHEVGDKSCGIIKHRHNSVGNNDGGYNVGIIYFKNNEIGRAINKWWLNGVFKGENPEYATCGDQKYLEGFAPNFGVQNIAIIDEITGHGAPWNFRLYNYDQIEQGLIGYGPIMQKLVFNHFSRLNLSKLQNPWPTSFNDFTSGQYAAHTLNFQVFLIPAVQKFYRQYAQELLLIKNELKP